MLSSLFSKLINNVSLQETHTLTKPQKFRQIQNDKRTIIAKKSFFFFKGISPKNHI